MPPSAEHRIGPGRAALWVPVAIYAAAIFLLSSIQDPGTLPGDTPDYVAHAALYAGFSIVIARALCGARWSTMSAAHVLGATIAATAYGLTDEIHQWFVPGRFFQARDLLADLGGAALGAASVFVAVRAVQTWRPARTRSLP